jgi:hypothetical protein
MAKSAKDEGRRKAAPGQRWLRLPGMVRAAPCATVIGAGLAWVDEVLERERVALCGERYAHLASSGAARRTRGELAGAGRPAGCSAAAREHKKRTVTAALPERRRGSIRSAMNQAYATRDPKRARRLRESLARRLEHPPPDAAVSLRAVVH